MLRQSRSLPQWGSLIRYAFALYTGRCPIGVTRCEGRSKRESEYRDFYPSLNRPFPSLFVSLAITGRDCIKHIRGYIPVRSTPVNDRLFPWLGFILPHRLRLVKRFLSNLEIILPYQYRSGCAVTRASQSNPPAFRRGGSADKCRRRSTGPRRTAICRYTDSPSPARARRYRG